MSTKNLLLELFVEELPPKALKKIGEAFAQTLQASLQTQGLLSADSVLTAFASPRRLGVHLTKVLEQADDKTVMQKLMPAAVGIGADGKATPALLKKLAALGADESAVAGLKRESDGKAEVLFFNSVVTGVMLTDGLQKALEETLGKLPIPKVMAYQLADGWETVNFVRPAHGLVALYGADVLNISVLGLHAGNTTHGHRFEAGIDPVYIRDADSYAKQIATEGAVIASFAERRAEIVRQLASAAAEAGSNLTPIEDEALLDEVTGLVERPNVLIGQFEEAFLEVPQECLILTMKANQKYFPLLDSKGGLSNKFLIVSNIRPADASTVIGGNERVVRPRLADAKFFFDQDRKKTLMSRVAGLDKVVYHNKLGTQGERIARVRAIAQAIAGKLGVDAQQADTAAQLAKADLLTDMVGEFPELQGIMGRYYALHDGLPAAVADAIEDHYKPRFAGDELPRNPVGMVVALADKLETLVGLFSIGQVPTGDKDPFALRRHALGIIRMLIEGKLDIGINDLITAAEKPFNGLSAEHRSALLNFIFDRLANALREQGYSAQEIDAVLALQPQRLADVAERLAAVRAFAALPEAASLAAANKRVGNILKKVEGTVAAQVDTALLKEPAEIALNQTLTTVKPQAEAAFARGDYTASLQALAALRNPVDAFFDGVMVNAEDIALRNNRQGLLATLHQAMNQVADISKLAA
ncbi:glycyl-tRNA synthetase, beta chain [Janthinobacterium sp. Marseille]|uniref:Glycine--tRNA ligase beta subunit n=1 Tax=Janthinobacterium sp. (strain Marseille) TaxID=375286 RepID=SYGB_JANMA|nr:glycine--tRNA ligase subunit beta [Janthinobacterium sp. Marseille]A6SV18.1 RecName: Full=Glycine--tRNA ligase beta subunit; AltName: Full=Glycyl-tRNA synthetase beta subunit; Short=GlyRS [Janthinobacterium sp. Marseille]ABR89000.1 glycyl-tRNA synthetase, beta chain [Janthinobacterium sp. Marseille]